MRIKEMKPKNAYVILKELEEVLVENHVNFEVHRRDLSSASNGIAMTLVLLFTLIRIWI